MGNIWDKFDKNIDTAGLAQDCKEAADNGGSYKEVVHGDYEVKITKLELVESKAGDPMVSCWMKIISGDFKNSIIFMNQVITKGFQVHIVDEFLRSLDTTLDIEFTNYKQYAKLLMDIAEEIDDKFEFALSYKKGKKDFSTFTITEVFEVE